MPVVPSRLRATTSLTSGTPRHTRIGAVAIAISITIAGCSDDGSTTNDSTTTAAIESSTTGAESTTTSLSSEATTTSAAAAESTTTGDASSATGSGRTAMVTAQVTAANAYLASLTDAQRSATVFAADDVSTMQGAWSNLPAPLFDARQGVKFGELTDAQREAALALVKSMTSDQGYEQVLAILAADDYLGTNSSGAGPGGQALEWTSDAYRVAIYGEPSETAQWLVQFGGHHLALHLASGTATSASPSFTGVEPLTFTYEGKEYAPMVAESKAVFELINSFTAHQATAATLAGTFDGVVVGPGEDGNFPAAEGMAYADLDAAQQAMVANIIKLWVGDAADATSVPLIDTYTSQLADTKIGWSGGKDEATQNSYLRIDGPRLWIEFSVVPAIGSGEPHFHTVYRDKAIDYGQS